MPERFDRQALASAFSDLGRRAWRLGRVVEIAVYGGSALALAFDWRQATRDVDAVFEGDSSLIRGLATEIAAERGWPSTWLNDGVKGFLSVADAAERVYFGTFPNEAEPGLRVFTASPRYLFAMKCRAMRIAGADGASDIDDIRNLGRELGIVSATQAFDIIADYFPRRLIEPKTQFGIEELFPDPEPGDSA